MEASKRQNLFTSMPTRSSFNVKNVLLSIVAVSLGVLAALVFYFNIDQEEGMSYDDTLMEGISAIDDFNSTDLEFEDINIANLQYETFVPASSEVADADLQDLSTNIDEILLEFNEDSIFPDFGEIAY